MMHSYLQLFWNEAKGFCRKNWWVFVILALTLTIIFKANRGNVAEVATIFTFHFTADIFIMMMIYKYSIQEYREGTYCQLVTATIFFFLALHSGLAKGSWQYFSTEAIYILALIKNYGKFVKKMNVDWISTPFMALVSAVVLFGIYVPAGLLKGSPQWIQTIGMLLFAVALSITNRESTRYLLSIVGLAGMVIGSCFEARRTFMAGDVVGLDISYMLLPATVLIVYIRLWRSFVNKAILARD